MRQWYIKPRELYKTHEIINELTEKCAEDSKRCAGWWVNENHEKNV